MEFNTHITAFQRLPRSRAAWRWGLTWRSVMNLFHTWQYSTWSGQCGWKSWDLSRPGENATHRNKTWALAFLPTLLQLKCRTCSFLTCSHLDQGELIPSPKGSAIKATCVCGCMRNFRAPRGMPIFCNYSKWVIFVVYFIGHARIFMGCFDSTGTPRTCRL